MVSTIEYRVRPARSARLSACGRSSAHPRIEQIEDGVLIRIIESGYRARALEVESTGEHRTPLQQRLFAVVEEVVRPRDRVAQRLVAFLPAPRPDQQPESVI